MRTQLFALTSIYYVICLGLLSSNFIFNLAGRPLLFTICDGIVLIARVQNEEANILATIILHISVIILFELIFYV